MESSQTENRKAIIEMYITTQKDKNKWRNVFVILKLINF